jgi:tetratricopeptide (TPR) repeat protein
MKLNLGCGYNKIHGYINVDLSSVCQPDVVINLDELPWPWEDNCVEEVLFTHCLEHLGGESRVFLGIMKELYRVCKDGARIYVAVPHPRHDNFIGDPTHVRIISVQVLSLFNWELNSVWKQSGYSNTPLAHYLDVDFAVIENNIVLDEPYLSQHKSGILDDEAINIALKEKNNVASEINITLQVRKTFLRVKDLPCTQNQSISDFLTTGIQCYNDGRYSEAELIYRKALEYYTNSAEIHKNLGNTLLSLNRFEDAEQAYRQALVFQPDYAEAYNNLGNVLRLCGRLDEAESSFSSALALVQNAEICNNFGNVLMDLGKIEEAEKVYRKAIVLKPDYHMAYNNRGNALLALKRWNAAEKSYCKALEIYPDYSEAYCGLGNLFSNDQSRFNEAERSYEKALVIRPDYVEAYYNLANLYNNHKMFDDAERAYRQALIINPSYYKAQNNLSFIKLLQGEYSEGFKLYESRFNVYPGSLNIENCTISSLNQSDGYSLWKGESLEGVTLSILTEQGAGDTLMMMRYLSLLKQKGVKKLIVYSLSSLQRVLQSLQGVDEVVSDDGVLPFGLYCPMMSLPFFFNTSLESVPNRTPYIHIAKNDKRKWRSHLAKLSGIKVGLVWAGGKFTESNEVRSIPLSKFYPLQKIEGVQIVSLQKGDEAIQLRRLGWNVFDRMEDCEDYWDTATLIDCLDLVISVDTAVAHLAGALGKPVWLLNRFESEWRWMLEREDSPWYPSMRIFRQKEKGDWGTLINLVAEELEKLVL